MVSLFMPRAVIFANGSLPDLAAARALLHPDGVLLAADGWRNKDIAAPRFNRGRVTLFDAYDTLAANCHDHSPGGNMPDLQKQFEAAANESKNLAERPDNDTLLRIYALYKQGSAGDAGGSRPGFTDMIGRAKYDAWAKVKGMSKEDAMTQYIALIDSLKG